MTIPFLRRIRACATLAVLPAAAAAQDEPPARRAAPPPMLLEPKDRVLVQRGFVPCTGELRLYACVVGTPAGVHYAYDFESGALLSIWRGPFADMVEIWGPRARNQTARPAGIETPLTTRPLLAQFSDRPMFEYPKTWPTRPAPLYSFQGYELEPDGQPVFLATFEALVLRDRIAPLPDGRGLIRRIEFSGKLPAWETWVLLAEADAIVARTDGQTWSAAQKGWTLRWGDDNQHTPIVRSEEKQQLLIVRLDRTFIGRTLSYSVVWGQP